MLHEVGPLGIGDATVNREIAHVVPLPGSDGAINVRQDELAPHLDVGIASCRAELPNELVAKLVNVPLLASNGRDAGVSSVM